MSGLRYAEPITDEADFERLRLRRQWRVGPRDDVVPDGWSRLELPGERTLDWHPDLRVRHHPQAEGGVVVLGLAVRPLGSQPAESGLVAEGSHRPGILEPLLHGLGGHHAVVAYDPDGVRIYTDPGGMMGVYFGQGRASSTPTLLPGLRRDPDIEEQYPLRGTDDWYPGSLTPFIGVRALIANHVLDLESGETRRFWPLEAPERVSHREGLERSGVLLKGMMRGFLDSAPGLISLTGGRDSRVNLAAAREWIDEVEFFTIRSPGVKKCDLEAPRQLAERFALDHRFVDDMPADPRVLELYDAIAANMALGSRREILGACSQVASSRYIHISGNLGAITKSFFWPSHRPKSVHERALAKEFINRAPCVMAGVREWLGTVPDLPAPVVYNLMYLEQRGGRWMGVGENAANLFYEPATPFCSRELFEVVCALPDSVQHGGTLLVDFVSHLWPEALEVPYCPVTRNWGTYLPKGLKAAIKKILGRS